MQGHLHRAGQPFTLRCGMDHVVGIRRAAVADQFAEDVRAARNRVIGGFEHEHCRSLAADEAAASGIEGAAGAGRIALPRRQCLHVREADDADRHD